MREDLLPETFDKKLAHLVEECGEVLKAIGKIQRFGESATDPVTHIFYNNLLDLKLELQDLKHAIECLE